MRAGRDREDFTRDQRIVQSGVDQFEMIYMVFGSLDCINFQKVDRMKLYELLKRKPEGIGKLSSAIFAMEMLVIE